MLGKDMHEILKLLELLLRTQQGKRKESDIQGASTVSVIFYFF